MEKETKTAQKVITVSLILNVSITIVKFIAGVFGHSQALIADAVHSISDFCTDIAVLIGARYWSRPPDECHPHGHRRIETFVTILIGIILFAAGVGLGWDALERLQISKDRASPNLIAAFAALISHLFITTAARIPKCPATSATLSISWIAESVGSVTIKAKSTFANEAITGQPIPGGPSAII